MKQFKIKLKNKAVSETIQNKAKEQKGGFLSMLLGTFGASLLGNILAGKGVIRAGDSAMVKTKTVRFRVSWRNKVKEL